MLILLEWLGCIITFFYALSCIDARPSDYYGGYYYNNDNICDFFMTIVYFIGSLILGIAAYIHTKLEDADFFGFHDDYAYRSISYNNNYCNNKTAYSLYSIPLKTNNEVISDISKNYPNASTVINELVKHEIKKTSFFSFKKEPLTVTTKIIPKNNDITINNNEIVKKNIINGLIKVLNGYVCYENIGEIRKNIKDVKYDKDNNILVFFNETSSISLSYELSKNSIQKELRSNLPKYKELKVIVSHKMTNSDNND